MAASPPNSPIHATAIIVAETGLLITGPSGVGKTMLALRCMQAARLQGWHSALISDDRVRLEAAGQWLVASAPEAIAGLAEIRGTGLVSVPMRRSAVIHLVVAPGTATGSERIPVENETATFKGLELPLVRLRYDVLGDPLALLCACVPRHFPAPRDPGF